MAPFGPAVPSQISADLDVGRRPTDNCAEICEGTVGRLLPMREKGAVASPGKLQPLPPALDQLHAHAQATAVMAAVMGSADAADRVATRARLHVAAVGTAPDVCSGRVCSGALVRRLRSNWRSCVPS